MVKIDNTVKYLLISPQKIREVARVIKGLDLEAALAQLEFFPKRASRPLLTALKSAIANAANNFKLERDKLKIETIEIGEGPRLKRWRAVSRGTAHQYKKRTSHIKIILTEKENE